MQTDDQQTLQTETLFGESERPGLQDKTQGNTCQTTKYRQLR